MENTGRLAGKVALVTGGSRGIGAEITRRLAAEGADVGFTYLSGKAEAAAVAERVRSLGRRAFTVGADLAERARQPRSRTRWRASSGGSTRESRPSWTR